MGRDARSPELRDAIVVAGRELFVSRGYHGTRTADVAARAGTNEVTLFAHFGSKEKLFVAAIGERLEALSPRTFNYQVLLGDDPGSLPDDDARLASDMDETAGLIGAALFGGICTVDFRTVLAGYFDAGIAGVAGSFAGEGAPSVDPRLAFLTAWGFRLGLSLDRAFGGAPNPAHHGEGVSQLLGSGLWTSGTTLPGPADLGEVDQDLGAPTTATPSGFLSMPEPAKGRMSADERRAHLALVAKVLLVQGRSRDVTAANVAEAAGVSIGSVYRYFASKDDLFDLALARPLEDELAAVCRTIGGPSDRHGAVGADQLARLHVGLHGPIAANAVALGLTLLANQDAARDGYHFGVQAAVVQHIEEWYRSLRPLPDVVDPVALSAGVFGIHLSLAIYADLVGAHLDPRRLGAGIVALLFAGAMPAPKQ